MSHGFYTVSVIALVAGVLAVTGWWRLAFAAFRLNVRRMTVERLGLLVTSQADVERVDRIFASFAGGFNAMIAKPSSKAWRRYCDSLPVLYRPFAHEGAAMGYTVRHLFRYNPEAFEDRLVRARPEFRYLYYVGLGFWWGMRNYAPARLKRRLDGLDPLHRYLCYDGYGFKHAFFDDPKDQTSLRKLDGLEAYARNAAYQGVGRALWFRFLSQPEVLIDNIERMGVYADDVAAGVGLASVFVNPDRLDAAQELALRLPSVWHESVHLGMCFGLKARSINDPEQFVADLTRVGGGVRDAVWASIRECDRIELLVRSDREEDGYRRWRTGVMEWMARHIDYPLVGLRAGTAGARAVAATEAARVAPTANPACPVG